jgi:hypothetical protein
VAASTTVLCQSLVLTSSIQSLQKFEAKFDFLFKKFFGDLGLLGCAAIRDYRYFRGSSFTSDNEDP